MGCDKGSVGRLVLAQLRQVHEHRIRRAEHNGL